MDQPLSDGGNEMLRAAVNAAREHQCRTLARLKERLAAAWPGRAADIDEAINRSGRLTSVVGTLAAYLATGKRNGATQ